MSCSFRTGWLRQATAARLSRSQSGFSLLWCDQPHQLWERPDKGNNLAQAGTMQPAHQSPFRWSLTSLGKQLIESVLLVLGAFFWLWLTHAAEPPRGPWPAFVQQGLGVDLLSAAYKHAMWVIFRHHVMLKQAHNVLNFFLTSGSQRWDTFVRTFRSSWLAARLTSGRIKSVQGSSKPWIWPPLLTHRYGSTLTRTYNHCFKTPRCVILHVCFAGWGDPTADECWALPRVFGEVSGERGGHFQRGCQTSSGL